MNCTAILLLLFGGIWTFFKAASFTYFRRAENLSRLFDALEVGVHAAWEQVIKPYLNANGGNAHLPADIREHAESVAISVATETDNIVTRFPLPVIRTGIKQAVEEAKRLGGV